MTRKSLLVKNINDFKNAKENYNLADYEIFSLDIETHNFLENHNISHKIAERYLTKDDHRDIFKHTISFYNWHEDSFVSKKFKFENFNLLSLFDTAELHHILIREIYTFFTVKRIIEKSNPSEILCNSNLMKIVKSISNNKILCEILDDLESNSSSPFEKYSFSFSFLGFNLPIKLSRKNYVKLKNFLESVIGKLFGLHYDLKNSPESILFLEINPEQYSNLLQNIKKNIIFLNQRRPAVWNWKSIKLLRKYNCKFLNPQSYFSTNEKILVSNISKKYIKELENFWKSEEIFSKLFIIEGCSFWESINDGLLKIYQNRLEDYITLIYFSKNIITKLNITCILSLNVFGETEKIILNGNPDISSILLEHGFINYVPELSSFDMISMYSLFKDKIAIWGPIQKDYLVSQHKIHPSRILMSGSPRHDDFFYVESKKNSSKKKILITPGGLDEANALYDTDHFIRFEKLLNSLFSILKNKHDVNIMVKLHPTAQKNNQYIKKYIHKIAPDVKMTQFTSSLKNIKNCDFMINIYTEVMPSTVLLEGMILKKPIMNISMVDESYNFEYLKDNAVLNISDKSNLEKNLQTFLTNSSLQEQLVSAATNHVEKYLTNPGTASKIFANMINSIK